MQSRITALVSVVYTHGFFVCTTHENKQLYKSYFANLFVNVDQFDSKQKNIQTVQTVNFHVPQLVTLFYIVYITTVRWITHVTDATASLLVPTCQPKWVLALTLQKN